jgi:hypothetical protein
MQKWKQKAIVQKIISYLPFSNKINYIFQKYVTKGVYLTDEYFYDRLGHAKAHLDAYQKYTGKPVPASSLEIGTGWYPVVPIAFFLSGSEKNYSVDISFLTSKDRLLTTLKKFKECGETGKLKGYIHVLPERYSVIEELLKNYGSLQLEDVLKKLNIIYLIEDARKLSLPDNSIDLVNSNNTFEHIYPAILIPILKDFRRVVKKERGVMSHFIDMSDHFAHFDKTISIYHFLQFSEKKWKRIDNSIQPQSRERIYGYKKIYADLQIPITEGSNRAGDVEELKKIRLDARFSGPLTETAVSHCHFVSDMNGVK